MAGHLMTRQRNTPNPTRKDPTMINGLPTLSKGAHQPGDGKACVMEYVALLAGEPWTDSPSCTHPVLARAAQVVNDRLPDEERHQLVPLIGRLFGTADAGDRVLSVRLAVWCARYVLRDGDAASLAAIEAAEAWVDCPCGTHADAAAAAAATTYASSSAAAYAAAATTNAASDAARPAHVAAYAADRKVAFLTGLLDEYDRLTGRTNHHVVTDTDLRTLAAAI